MIRKIYVVKIIANFYMIYCIHIRQEKVSCIFLFVSTSLR